MIMFKLGAHDYSDHVIAGSYQVNQQDVYKSWNDITGVEHREPIRTKLVGSFDMYFKNIEEYDEFQAVLKNAKQPDTSFRIAICDNTSNQLKVIDAYLTFQLTRNRDGFWNDKYERFKVNVQEK